MNLKYMKGLLSTTHPELWRKAVRHPAGLNVVIGTDGALPILFVKLPHRYLLTARKNKGFKIYVAPIEWNGHTTIGLFSAFFEDAANPLQSWTPLADEPHTWEILVALNSSSLEVRMVDEHDRELLGYTAALEVPLVSRIRLEHAKLYPTNHALDHGMSEAGEKWFAATTALDDAEAISINFLEPLFSEDRNFRDERPELFQFHGSKGFAEVVLTKLDPGRYQELDIILLLQRIFPANQIYHSPFQIKKEKEICDVLVITEEFCLIIEAKDSQNTEEALSVSLEKKQRKSLGQLEDACRQLSSAIRYLSNTQPLQFRIDDQAHTIDVSNRNLYTLAIIREKFEFDYELYSEKLLRLHQKIDFPCIALDYDALIRHCVYCDGPHNFANAYMQIFNDGVKSGLFKDIRFGVNSLYNENGDFRFD